MISEKEVERMIHRATKVLCYKSYAVADFSEIRKDLYYSNVLETW